MKAELYIRCSCINGEGPVWDEARQCLHFVDVFGNCIHTWENGVLSAVEVGENIGCAVPRSGGGLIEPLEQLRNGGGTSERLVCRGPCKRRKAVSL